MDQKNANIMISTLAREKGWASDDDNFPLYNCQGFWYYESTLQDIIRAKERPDSVMNLLPSDTIICSTPKCGTTWLKALSFVIATRNRFQGFEDHPLRLKNPHELVPFIEFNVQDQDQNKDQDRLPIFSTHIPYTFLPDSVLTSGCKLVYIWRDPKDVLISRWHFANKVRPNKDVTNPIPLEEAFELFCRGVTPYGPYWEHILGYWKAFLDCPDKILFLKYEDMMSDVEVYVKRLAEFMGFPFSKQEEKDGVVERVIEMCNFESLSNSVVNKKVIHLKGFSSISSSSFYRKGQVGDWENYLTKEMASEIDQIIGEKLGKYGLTL